MASTPADYQPKTVDPPLRPQPNTTSAGDAPRQHTTYGLTLPGKGEEALAALRAALEAVRDYCTDVARHAETAGGFLQGHPQDLHERAATAATALAGSGDDLLVALQAQIEAVREATTTEATFMAPVYEAADSTASGLRPVPTVGQLREG